MSNYHPVRYDDVRCFENDALSARCRVYKDPKNPHVLLAYGRGSALRGRFDTKTDEGYLRLHERQLRVLSDLTQTADGYAVLEKLPPPKKLSEEDRLLQARRNSAAIRRAKL